MHTMYRITALVAALLVSMAGQADQTNNGKSAPAFGSGPVKIEQVAFFPDQQSTGVAVSRTGRLFVSLPRLSLDNPISLGEVIDGKIRPYPDLAWNAYRSANGDRNKPAEQFVTAQAIVTDHQDNLWVLDPATPKRSGPIKGAVKLVKIDLARDEVVKVFYFDDIAVPEGASLNDVRFSPDDHFAYLSDVANPGHAGAIVVMDLHTGKAWRALDGDPSTQTSPDLYLMGDGKKLLGPDGKGLQLNIDGIEISPDGSTFYWQALTGDTVYSVPTADLDDPARALKAKATPVAKTHPADGLWIDRAGRFFVSNPSEDSVEVADHVGAPLTLLVKDKRMRWPDSFAQGADGALYVSASFIGDSPWFHPEAKTTPSAVFRITAGQ
ncbi:major royal jelly family protein [Pseudomonas silvicola]|nr:major royal jelly family protein [Pseudomonas silvicola]